MNRYYMIRRLRGPAFLLLIGICALLNQMHLMHWGYMWPLFLILWGVLMLAERMALSDDEAQYPPQNPYQQQGPYQQAPYAGGYPNPPAAAPVQETGIVPVHGDEIVPRSGSNEGGQA